MSRGVRRRRSPAPARTTATWRTLGRRLRRPREQRRAGRGADPRTEHENAPVEETEINYPVRILRYELVENSEGAGRFRGGLGGAPRLSLRRPRGDVHDPRGPRPLGAVGALRRRGRAARRTTSSTPTAKPASSAPRAPWTSRPAGRRQLPDLRGAAATDRRASATPRWCCGTFATGRSPPSVPARSTRSPWIRTPGPSTRPRRRAAGVEPGLAGRWTAGTRPG